MTKNKYAFREWLEQSGLRIVDVSNATGISDSCIQHLVCDSPVDFEPRKLRARNRKKLYEYTKLELFKTTPQLIAGDDVDLNVLNDWQQGLLDWMADRDYTIRSASRHFGIPISTMQSYVKRPVLLDGVKKTTRQAIYEKTKLDYFKIDKPKDTKVSSQKVPKNGTTPIQNKPQTHCIDSLVKEVNSLVEVVRERVPVAYRGENSQELVKRTVALYHALTDTLEGFKTKPDAIEYLKKELPAQQAGYLLGVVNAIYSKDPLSKWALGQSKPL